MILMLSMLNPNHPVFDMAYVAPKKAKKVAAQGMVFNYNGFFDGLPLDPTTKGRPMTLVNP